MALSLEQLTAAFKKQDTNESRPNNYYRFWDMKAGEQAVVRFLPDANSDNPLGFMVEKLMHTLEINGETKSVPCLKMFESECPICKVSAAYYKDEGKDSINGKKFWRNKQHIVQALIMEDPLPANPETGENSEGKVKFLNMGYQLYSVIKEAFESGELDNIPYLYEGGCDFIIKKSDLGGRAKYDVGSKFARRSSDLTEDEIAVAEDQMVDLSTLLPASPGLEKVETMLEAALTGGSYEDEGVGSTPEADASTPAASAAISESTSAAEPAAEYDEESDDILAIIRNRKNKAAE
jgi:hypothetical protein